jgi:hypothetical protein
MTTVPTGGSMNLHAALAACFFNQGTSNRYTALNLTSAKDLCKLPALSYCFGAGFLHR